MTSNAFEITDEMVEQAAKAIFADDYEFNVGEPADQSWWPGIEDADAYRRQARVALEAVFSS